MKILKLLTEQFILNGTLEQTRSQPVPTARHLVCAVSRGCQATEFRAFLGYCLSCEEALIEDRNVLILWIFEDHL